jgi:hypothetical protein
MEPRINFDLTHDVAPPFDLTFALLSDIGWVPTALPASILVVGGSGQRAAVNTQFSIPLVISTSPAINGIQITWTINPVAGAGGTFSTSGTRFALSTTNANGVADAPPIIASGNRGNFTVTATAPGAGTTTFTLRAATPNKR